MLKSAFLLFTVTMLFATCTNDDCSDLNNTCMVQDPVTDLPWLKQTIQRYEETKNTEMYRYLYIAQATFKGRTVFIFGNCCPNCNTVIPVNDCQGKFLFYRFDKEQADKVKDEKVIWQAENSLCHFM
jgi:hypothetical protein